MKRIFLLFIAIAFLCFSPNSFSYERDERRAFQEIETLMLKGDYGEVKSKCDRFIRDYRRGRLRSKVYSLRKKAIKKIESDESARVSASSAAQVEDLPSDTYYIIQVGAYKKYNNAYKVKRELKRQKIDSIIIKTKKNGKTLYKVSAGKFRNLDNAEKLLKRLKKKGYAAEIING